MAEPGLTPSSDDQRAPVVSKETVDEALAALMDAVDVHVPFGPGFFCTRLRAFVRDRCPNPAEALPLVEIALDTGEVIDVCHVIGLAPLWIALAARDPRRFGEATMRTEIIPYATIRRITIRPISKGSAAMGFDREHQPALLVDAESSPEATLSRAAGVQEAEGGRSDVTRGGPSKGG